MTLEEQYTRLLAKSRKTDALSFLKNLSSGERRSLAPLLKKLSKEYLSYQQHGSTWRYKASEQQRIVLNYAFFVCYNQKEFEKASAAWLINREFLENFLSWYVPGWLSSYINGFAGRDWLPYQLDYDYVVELSERGAIEPAPQLLARMLVPHLFEQTDRRNRYAPERLLKYSVTLQRHVWHLFEYETNLHYSNRYLYNDGKPLKGDWATAFMQLVVDDRLDKQRLLSEALLAGNRNFNKNLSGWFAGLFVRLSPTEEETLELQTELFTCFASPHGKVVHTALQAVKTVLFHPRFQIDAFLEYAPVLLTSGTKAVVAAALQALEKAAKAHPGKRPQICALATGALVHKDEGLQTRAAKLIQKFGDEQDEAITQSLALYNGTLFSAARALLTAFVREEEAPVEDAETSFAFAPKGALTDGTALPQCSTVNDLIFLAAQAFDNNESWHIDLLPAAMINLQKEWRGGDVARLEPAIQRALKLYFGDWHSTQGALDQLLASLFLDGCLILIQKFPAETASARGLFKTFMYKSEENKKLWDEHGPATTFLSGWRVGTNRELFYTPYKKLFDAVLTGLRQGSDLPLLCAPTHAPAWIDPVVLVERLRLHQQQDLLPESTDLQMALSRCWLHGTEEAVQAAKQKLRGELRELLLFLLEADAPPAGPFTLEAAWMAAALSKGPQTIYPQLEAFSYGSKPRVVYTGQYPWQTIEGTYTYDKYDWVAGKYGTTKATAQRKVIVLDLSAQSATSNTAKESGFKKFFARLAGGVKEPAPPPEPLLYDYMRIRERWLSNEDKDIRRIYLLAPNHPEPVMALTLQKCLLDPAFFSETHKRFVVGVLQAVYDTSPVLAETGHLLIATCLLCADKTAATYAAEIWLQAAGEKRMDSAVLGRILGRHQRIEFAPFKRLTDLLSTRLPGVSAQHNQHLGVLVAALLKELPDVPLKGLRKLLEIHAELLRLNGASVNDDSLKDKLKKWKEAASLRKVIGASV